MVRSHEMGILDITSRISVVAQTYIEFVFYLCHCVKQGGQQQNTETERQHLLDRLLDAVKQVKIGYLLWKYW